MNPIRLAARGMLASTFITGGVSSLRDPGPRAEAAKPVIDRLRGVVPQLPPDDETVVRIDSALHVVFGTTLLLGKFQRTSALVLAATLVPTTVGGHRFWEKDDDSAKANQAFQFQKNVSMLGGLLFAALDRKGKPSLTYRAEKAGSRAKKVAKGASKALPVT
jgi:putative oxidoreductase